MTISRENEEIDNYLLEPFARLTQFVVAEARYVGLVPRAITIAGGFRFYANLARQMVPEDQTVLVAGFDRLLEEQDKIEFMVKEIHREEGDSFRTIYRHSVIGLWTAVEVAAEDTCVLALSRSAEAVRAARSTGVKIPATTPDDVLGEDDARLVLSRIERRLRQSIEGNKARLLAPILGAIGIPVSVPAPDEIALSELCYLRNCLLHLGGRIDSRVKEEAPHLGQPPGEDLRLDEECWSRQYDTAGTFGKHLLNGITRSRYTKFQNPKTGDIEDGRQFDTAVRHLRGDRGAD